MAPPQPPQRPQVYPIFDRPHVRRLQPTLSAVVAVLLALVMLFLGSGLLVDSIELASRGVVVQAEVVSSRHGSKSDYVEVRLPPPASTTVDLTAWSGAPRTGDVIVVRYIPSSPEVASQDGQWPWFTTSLLFAAAAFLLFGAWWAASRPWRRARRS
jgi:hypothetical protein